MWLQLIVHSISTSCVDKSFRVVDKAVITGADLEILERGFFTTASGLLISQPSLMVTISF